MKNTIHFILVIFAAYLFNQNLLAQNNTERIIEDDEYTKVTPPSPTAYELGKYGQVPVGYFTGTPNISIPLYTYNAGNLAIPISLSYNSNGIKVDQLSSNVGLGWSLNVGGVITRIVKDEPDEESYRYFPESEIQNPYSPLGMEYLTYGSQGDNDTEADVFMYNFMGNSGKFVYDNDKKIVLIPVKDIKIEPIVDGYKLTTADGIIYEFTNIETTQSFNQLQTKNRDLNPPLTTAWYLTKIVHPAGDQVNFIYASDDYDYDNSITQYHEKSFPTSNGCSGEGPSCGSHNSVATYKNNSKIKSCKISKITSSNAIFGTVNISYNVNHPSVNNYKLISGLNVQDSTHSIVEDLKFDYLSTSKNRIFLTKLTYSDTTKQFNFEYINPGSLCERLSFSQDYWGYYNGATNNYLLPKTNDGLYDNSPYSGDREPHNQFSQMGLLKKITYPTKGFNEFEYEMNSYFGKETIYPPKDHLYLDVYAAEYGTYFDQENTKLIKFDHEAFINTSVFFDTLGGCEQQTYTAKAHVSVEDINTSTLINLYEFSTNLGWYSAGTNVEIIENAPREFKVSFKEGHTYNVRISVNKPCNGAILALDYYSGNIQINETNLETGGSRIKRILTAEPVNGLIDTTSFYYNTYEKLNESSGDPGSKGVYISKRTNRLDCAWNCSYYDCEYYVLQTNSFTNLFNTGSNNVYYNTVTVSHGGDNFRNGGETHEFIIHRDYQGDNIVGDGYAQSPSSWTNFGWDNGLEKSVTTFKIDNQVLKPVSILTNNYVNDLRMADTVYSYAITKNFNFVCPPNISYVCKESDVNSYHIQTYCATSHHHEWYGGFFGTRCIFIGNNNINDTVWHPCHFYSPGYTLVYTDAIENLSVIKYMNLSSWNYLKMSTLEEFSSDDNGKITKSTEYFYDNPSHLQLSRAQTNDSKGNLQQTQTYFPQDYDTSIFSNLIHKHMVNKPIDQRSLYKGKLQNGRLIHYNDLGQPVDVYQAETEKGSVLAFNENNPYSYANDVKKKILAYDPQSHNLISFKNEGDMETVIVWGYNYSKPIAKIENVTIAVVEQVLVAMGESYASLQTKSSGELLVILKELRDNSSLENSMITSYTYDPMIGMTTVTDPNGVVTTYHYDEFNRLETIRDLDNNVIKQLDYHYQE